MLNRVSALSLVFGVVAGYAVRGTGVTAQDAPPFVPLNVGETVMLSYEKLEVDRIRPMEECTVLELRGVYVRCAAAKDSKSFQTREEWRNLRFVVGITKQQK